jgi:hypothetical protein
MLRRVDSHSHDALTRFLQVLFAFIAEMEPPKSLRKPMNPVLGETAMHSVLFPDSDERFDAVWEQVSHHPPVSAHHTSGGNIVVSGHVAPKPHLVGAHVEVTLVGRAEVRLLDRDESYVVAPNASPTFEWKFVPKWYSRMKPREVWKLECAKTGYYSEVWYTTKCQCHQIKGRVFHASNASTPVCEIDGRYDGSVVARRLNGDAAATLLTYDTKRDVYQSKGKIIKQSRADDERDTDVVWGECYEAMDDHRWEDARKAKRKVEEAEREERRRREARGDIWKPRFFTYNEQEKAWTRDPYMRVVFHD